MVHNSYAKVSGEEIMVSRIAKLLVENGHTITEYYKYSSDLLKKRFGKFSAFVFGIHNPYIVSDFKKYLHREKPDIIQVQNVYPQISPSILFVAKSMGIPIVHRVANYRLMCPTGLFLCREEICQKCLGGHEYFCVLQNCEEDIFKSIGYAVRNFVARKRRAYYDNVNIYVAQTEFQKRILIASGFEAHKIHVIPNMVEHLGSDIPSFTGEYVAYVGRISPEKGIDVLLKAATMLPNIPFKVAGDYGGNEKYLATAPKNVSFIGHLGKDLLHEFYLGSRFIVVPSKCFEGFPSVLIEGMVRKKPAVCSDIGGFNEIIEDEITGVHYKTGDHIDLAEKISLLWNNDKKANSMGEAAYLKVTSNYTTDKYYRKLITAYEAAIKLQAGEENLEL